MSSKANDGGAAFPHQFEDVTGNKNWVQSQGMTLRDWFAGQALSCIPLRSWDHVGGSDQERIEAWARCAYLAADAMIAARKAGAE